MPFGEALARHNNLYERGFRRWAFYPGMLFRSSRKWWGNDSTRRSPHEGLDFCFFRSAEGVEEGLLKAAAIPAAFGGEVKRVERDFIGKTLYLRHGRVEEAGKWLYTIYGHTVPLVQEGRVEEGQVIATVAEKASIKAHLHLTLALVPDSMPAEGLSWETLAAGDVELLDPLCLVPDYEILEGKAGI
jgi:hypothetical protein